MINMSQINQKKVLENLYQILDAYNNGELAAESMPEDANPNLDLNSLENTHYFTFPMALNYQRDSYTLWKNCKKLYGDKNLNYLFNPKEVVETPWNKVQADLLHYKVALQPNKHVNTWVTLSQTFFDLYDGDVRNLFVESNYEIDKILNTIQVKYKLVWLIQLQNRKL
jgi:hypothetical protein